MRIAIINNLYSPNERGGAEQVARRQAEHFSQKDFVLVVTSAVSREQVGLEKINDNYFIYRIWASNFYPYYDLPKHNFLSRGAWRLRDMFGRKTARQIAALLNEQQIEKVILHNLTGLSYQTPKFISQEKILLLHDVQLIHPSGQLSALRPLNFLEKVYVSFTKKFFASVKKIICPSKFLADYYAKCAFAPAAKFRVISNGVPDENYRQREGFLSHPDLSSRGEPDEIGRRARDLINNDQIKLLFVGQLHQAKGIDQILPLILQNKNLSLSVIGDGPEQALVENYAQQCDRIKYYGRVPQSELWKFYDEHQYLLFASKIQENLPTVILEAGARALPVIAAGVGGVPELIEDQKNGFLYNPFDKNSLSLLLSYLPQVTSQFYGQMQEEMRRRAGAWRASMVWEEWDRIWS
jgi:glycosyltransferase involved in cell wall biosynthesis